MKLSTQKIDSSLNEEPPADPEDFESSFKELCILVLSRDREIIDLIRRELGSDPPSGVEPEELRIWCRRWTQQGERSQTRERSLKTLAERSALTSTLPYRRTGARRPERTGVW